MMKRPFLWIASLLVVTAMSAGCRGQISDKPPVHIVPDMDWQNRYDPLEASPFFEDGRAARPPVEGTVAQGLRHLDDPLAFDAYYKGKKGDGWVAVSPVTPSHEDFERGQERYDIYCAVCHDRAGAGNGIVVKRGFPRPINLADRVGDMSDGEIFNVITEGVRNMPSYAHQVSVEDRWRIVAWLRVLEKSQRATTADVPAGTPIAKEVSQ